MPCWFSFLLSRNKAREWLTYKGGPMSTQLFVASTSSHTYPRMWIHVFKRRESRSDKREWKKSLSRIFRVQNPSHENKIPWNGDYLNFISYIKSSRVQNVMLSKILNMILNISLNCNFTVKLWNIKWRGSIYFLSGALWNMHPKITKFSVFFFSFHF